MRGRIKEEMNGEREFTESMGVGVCGETKRGGT